MTDQPMPPGLMFRSFLTVGSGFVLVSVAFVCNMYLLGILFFPEFIEFFNSNPDAQRQVMENDPSTAIPHAMVAAMVVLNGITCFLIGWYVARTAPFGNFAHAVFLAVFTFVYFLQIVIADPQPKKWMDVIYMGALPIAILYGAKFCLDRWPETELDDDQSIDDNA